MTKTVLSLCFTCVFFLYVSCTSTGPATTPEQEVPAEEQHTVTAVEAQESEASVSDQSEENISSEVPQVSPGDIADPKEPDGFIYFYPEPSLLLPEPMHTQDDSKSVQDPPQELPKEVKIERKKEPEAKPEAEPEGTAEPGGSAEVEPDVAQEPLETPEAGIWEKESVPPSVSPTIQSTPVKKASREVTVPRDFSLEVWYPGTGWVYLGDSSSLDGLSYQTRKIDGNDTLFSFRALKEGSYLLEFSRYDVLGDSFVSDLLAVQVKEPGNIRSGKVRAPDYRSLTDSSIVETAPDPVHSVMIDEPELRPVTTPVQEAARSVPVPTEDPLLLLEEARKAIAQADSVRALEYLDSFFTVARASLDEGWFLRAQAYEANTPLRDIRKALSAYETVTSVFPDSVRWKESDERIRYIKQFYFRVR